MSALQTAPKYVVISCGDGYSCEIVDLDKLDRTVHDLMCSCASPFACEVFAGIRAELNDADRWASRYPDYQRDEWRLSLGDGSIRVVRLTAIQEAKALPGEMFKRLMGELVGKWLRALSGNLPGYSPEIDALLKELV